MNVDAGEPDQEVITMPIMKCIHIEIENVSHDLR